MIDYKELLKKYMRHVGREEGAVFLPSPEWAPFSQEECAELQRMDSEILAEEARK